MRRAWRSLVRAWRGRSTATVRGATVAVASAERGRYDVAIDGRTFTVHARWFDTPTTIALRFRWLLWRAGF